MHEATPTAPYSQKTIDLFWAKVNKTGECWEWTGTRRQHGHGSAKISGMNVGAHRVSYQLHFGPIPDGMVIDHTCHNPPCVNPAHLRAVRQKQNMENRIGAHANSKSGVRGVSWHKARRTWNVTVKHNGKSLHGGSFRSIAEAEGAAIALRNKLFTHNDADRVQEPR